MSLPPRSRGSASLGELAQPLVPHNSNAPSVEVKPWREVKRKAKLRIGVLYDDGVVRPVAPVRRALDAAVAKLKAAGHEVVEFTPFKSAENWSLIVGSSFTSWPTR